MNDASVARPDPAGDPNLADRPQRGRLVDGEHRYPIAVQFEDTDLSGAVDRANYLRYFERARSDLLRLVGIDQRAVHAAVGGYVVHAAVGGYAVHAAVGGYVVHAAVGGYAVHAAGGGYVVASADLRYLRPARFDDTLLVATRIVGFCAAGVDVHQTLIRDGAMLAHAAITAVLVGAAGRPRRQPRDRIAAFEAIRGRPVGRTGADRRHGTRAHRREMSA